MEGPLSDHGVAPSADEVFVSVVIPAYNEEGTIKSTLSALLAHLRSSDTVHEVIVVDDGSEDNTVEEVDSLIRDRSPVMLLKNAVNRGKGSAVRRGVLNSQGRYVFFMDADFSYPVQEIDKMLVELENGYDVVIGSRALPESRLEVRPPLLRYIAGQAYSVLIGLLVFGGIPDTQCGFKGFRREVAVDLFSRLTLNDFAFDVELLFLARKHGYKIRAVPVTLRFNAQNSKVRLLRDSILMLADLVKIRFNDATGRYDTGSGGRS